MKKILIALFALITLTATSQVTTPRFSTSPSSGDNTGRVLTYGYVAPVYAATYVVVANAYETTVKMGELTGAQTLTATVTKCQAADKLNIIFDADGTNRVVTFSTGFASGGNITVNANTTMTVNFSFNGVGWVQLTANDLVFGLAGNGTEGAPTIGFTSDTDNGLYRIGANNVGFSIGGAKVLDVASDGVEFTGHISTTTGNVYHNTATAFTENDTVTAGEIAGGLLTITSGTDTLTMPTVAALVTQLGAAAGSVFEFNLLNIADGGTALIRVNTGMTASGFPGTNTLSLAKSTTVGIAGFRISFLSATAAT